MKIDLNLFTVFNAIYCEGNITRAALSLNLSQPAVSHALAKLRAHFGDPLFVRQGNQMKPTSVAKNAIGEVRIALHQLQLSLLQSKQFDPKSSNKHFTISLHSSLEAYYLPLLMKQLIKNSPNLQLTSNRTPRNEMENTLASGDFDIAIDILLPVSNNILHTPLDQDKLVVVSRKDNPAIPNFLDTKTYLAQTHVVVSSRVTGSSIEDFELSRHGLHRKIGLRCQHLFSACRVITGNDMLLTLPETAAKMFSEGLPISIYPFPFEMPYFDLHLYWHQNVNNEPANHWLRNEIINASRKS